jgi:hypothetical protein
MHIAPNKIHAVVRVVSASLRTLGSARALALCCSLVGVGLTSGLTSAWADQGDGRSGRRDERGQQSQPEPQSREDGRGQQRPAENRGDEQRADEHRRTQQEQGARNADGVRRNGRLTEDQRRDLRRQINEAGQDIYATPPRR